MRRDERITQTTYGTTREGVTTLFFIALTLHLWQYRTMEQTKTPYELCIAEFGGVRELARQVGRDAGSVSKWKKHGTIPTGIQKKVLEKAWELNLNITPYEIIFGRE